MPGWIQSTELCVHCKFPANSSLYGKWPVNLIPYFSPSFHRKAFSLRTKQVAILSRFYLVLCSFYFQSEISICSSLWHDPEPIWKVQGRSGFPQDLGVTLSTSAWELSLCVLFQRREWRPPLPISLSKIPTSGRKAEAWGTPNRDSC